MITWKLNKETNEYESSAVVNLKGQKLAKYIICKAREKRYSNVETYRLYERNDIYELIALNIKTLKQAKIIAENEYNNIINETDFDKAMQ